MDRPQRWSILRYSSDFTVLVCRENPGLLSKIRTVYRKVPYLFPTTVVCLDSLRSYHAFHLQSTLVFKGLADHVKQSNTIATHIYLLYFVYQMSFRQLLRVLIGLLLPVMYCREHCSVLACETVDLTHIFHLPSMTYGVC